MTGVARLGVGIALVGRRPEVSALGAALDRATLGKPTGVLMSGDAGVGKSRLVAETVERAAAAGFTVLVGRCLDTAESALPYLPFTEIVGTLAATRPELVAEHVALRHLLPGGFAPGTGTGEPRDLGQLQVFDAVLSVLDDLSAATPVLLVVEDLHWSDRSSRDLLAFLLSRLTGQRLVVLATYRSDDLHRRHPLRPVLSELVRLPAVERIDLAPLDAVQTLELVRLLADGSLAEPKLRNIARSSEGNAFFAEELVSASTDGLPHGLVEVLVARIERLSPATQGVLRIASVAGRRVSHARLAAVSGLPVDELEHALREAVAHHVLVAAADEQGALGTDDAYVFRHALLREAIYHELLPGERSRLHAAYAALLAVPGGAGPRGVAEPGRAAELAHHAMAGHDLPMALVASVQAAAEADDRAAPAEVLLHAERAIELWRAVPDAAAVAGVDEVTVTRWAAWGASGTGDPDRGIALGRRALELADERGDPVLKSELLCRYALRLLDLAGHELEALAAAREALELAPREPLSADLAWSHVILARVLGKLDQFAEAMAEAEAALDVARQVHGDAEIEKDVQAATADALVTLAVCAEYGGNPERARQLLAEAKPLARQAGNLPVELRTFYSLGISLLDEGRLAEAGAEFAAGEDRARATGTTWSAYGLELRVAHVLTRYMRGEWDAAEAAAEIAGESVSATVAFRLAAAGLLTAVGRGRFAAARRRLEELRESAPVDEQVIMLVGQAGAEAALWQGRPDEAARCVRDAVAGLNTGAYSDLAPHLGRIMLGALGVAAHADMAAAGLQPLDEATTAAREMVRIAEEAAERGLPRAGRLGPEGRAWLQRARAELTRLEGPPDPAAWQQVVAAFGYETGGAGPCSGPAPVGYRQAYAMVRRAEAVLAGGGTPALVEPDLRAAYATATTFGAEPLAGALRVLAERAGIRVARGEPAPAGPDPLTPRERSVLALVAEGRTNRQVGSELFISEKTVSVHLSRVMAKLGASSRTEAVSLAYGRGLLAPKDRELARQRWH
jgi:DNA-binding CsgD family transcriptional regulator/tetratricopeptide (TPR) repeat protein